MSRVRLTKAFERPVGLPNRVLGRTGAGCRRREGKEGGTVTDGDVLGLALAGALLVALVVAFLLKRRLEALEKLKDRL
ncbi:MAG: hypothetical protein ACLFSW_00795 [Halobacteriales archaeon]